MKDGGPAFPQTNGQPESYPQCAGMSLRDYLAGQAIVGLLAARGPRAAGCAWHCVTEAYEVADRMIRESK